MGRSQTLFGDADMPAPTPATAEDAASEYQINRAIFGDYASKPRVERWREDLRKRFEAELRRLEAERVRQVSEAVRASQRS